MCYKQSPTKYGKKVRPEKKVTPKKLKFMHHLATLNRMEQANADNNFWMSSSLLDSPFIFPRFFFSSFYFRNFILRWPLLPNKIGLF